MRDASTDEVEELIKEIAHKHGIAVGRDDPILVLQTLNQRLLAGTARSQEQALSTFKSEIELIYQTWSSDAKDKAERIINAALASSRDAMHTSMTQATKSALESLDGGLKSILSDTKAAANNARKTAALAVIASILAISSSALAMFFVFSGTLTAL